MALLRDCLACKMREQYKNYRLSDIQQKLDRMTIRPLDVLVVGGTGGGKSETLNAFFQEKKAVVGEGADPETSKVSYYIPESVKLNRQKQNHFIIRKNRTKNIKNI